MSSHAHIPLYKELPKSDVDSDVDSDIEMANVVVDRGSSYFEGIEDGEVTDVDQATPPLPKKKKKAVEVVAPKVVKAPKVKLRDAIKAAQVSDSEMAPSGKLAEGNDSGVLDLDPTPKKKSKPAPVAESDSDQAVAQPFKPGKSRTVPVLSDGDNMDVEPKHKSEGKAKGKAKEKLPVAKRDNEVDRAPSKSEKRVLPKLYVSNSGS
jgi:hypothetical protein